MCNSEVNTPRSVVLNVNNHTLTFTSTDVIVATESKTDIDILDVRFDVLTYVQRTSDEDKIVGFCEFCKLVPNAGIVIHSYFKAHSVVEIYPQSERKFVYLVKTRHSCFNTGVENPLTPHIIDMRGQCIGTERQRLGNTGACTDVFLPLIDRSVLSEDCANCKGDELCEQCKHWEKHYDCVKCSSPVNYQKFVFSNDAHEPP